MPQEGGEEETLNLAKDDPDGAWANLMSKATGTLRDKSLREQGSPAF